MRVVMASSFLVFALACGGGGKKAAYEPRSDAEAVTEAVALLVEMGEVVMSAGGDCDLMASKVGGWIDTNGARRNQINAYLARIDGPDAEQAYRQQLGQHLDVVHQMMAGIEHCDDHDGFMRAWKRLD